MKGKKRTKQREQGKQKSKEEGGHVGLLKKKKVAK